MCLVCCTFKWIVNVSLSEKEVEEQKLEEYE